jgi:hypothetical protein
MNHQEKQAFTEIQESVEFCSGMSNFQLALLDERMRRTAAHELGRAEATAINYYYLRDIIMSEYLLEKKDFEEAFEVVLDKLYTGKHE